MENFFSLLAERCVERSQQQQHKEEEEEADDTIVHLTTRIEVLRRRREQKGDGKQEKTSDKVCQAHLKYLNSFDFGAKS